MIYSREVLKNKKKELLEEKQRILNVLKDENPEIMNSKALKVLDSRIKDVNDAIKLIEKQF